MCFCCSLEGGILDCTWLWWFGSALVVGRQCWGLRCLSCFSTGDCLKCKFALIIPWQQRQHLQRVVTQIQTLAFGPSSSSRPRTSFRVDPKRIKLENKTDLKYRRGVLCVGLLNCSLRILQHACPHNGEECCVHVHMSYEWWAFKISKEKCFRGQTNPACTTVYLNLTYIHQRTPIKSYKERVYMLLAYINIMKLLLSGLRSLNQVFQI